MGLNEAQLKRLEELDKMNTVTYREGTREVHEVLEEYLTYRVCKEMNNPNLKVTVNRKVD